MNCEMTLLGFAYSNADGIGALAFAAMLCVTAIVLFWVRDK